MSFCRRFVSSVLCGLLILSSALALPSAALAADEYDFINAKHDDGVRHDSGDQSTVLEDSTDPEDETSLDDTSSVEAVGELYQNTENDDDSLNGSSSSYQYLYIAYPDLTAGTNQEIAFSSDDPTEVIVRAVLLVLDESGNSIEVEASSYSGNLAGFIFGKTYSEGTYRIESISYWTTEDDVEHFVDFGDSASSFVVTEVGPENQDLVTDVYYADSAGEIVEADSIEDAIENAELSAGLGFSTFSLEGRSSLNATNGAPVIALDPGHGGLDSGAIGNGKTEAELTWKIAVACRDRLEEYGFNVVMARDEFGSYDGNDFLHRVDRVLEQGAQVYVSLHINSATPSAKGAEVYAPEDDGSSNTVVSNELAQKVMDNLAALGLTYRGVKEMEVGNEFAVIRCAREAGIPGILIEHAFISNASDVAEYLSDEGCVRLGIADADAIIAQFPKTSWYDYSSVFDAEYYLEHNPDVKAAYGDDEDAALQHFVRWGMSEGRPSSPDFDVVSYYNANRDLRVAYYGTDLGRYYEHYMRWGESEGRTCLGVDEVQDYVSKLDGVDYSKVYDGAYYLENNGDLASAYLVRKSSCASVFDDTALLGHFVRWGMSEGRPSSPDFDVST